MGPTIQVLTYSARVKPGQVRRQSYRSHNYVPLGGNPVLLDHWHLFGQVPGLLVLGKEHSQRVSSRL
jgi:hypothetical protein